MAGSAAHVQVWTHGRIGRVRLNRPEAINALTLEMFRSIRRALDDWREDPRVSIVVLDGAGERGFCAGGDIRLVHRGALHDPASVRLLWREEYALDATIASYPKPVVTIADGLTMGGGMGLTAHASHRVVTERSSLAMPEVGIGLAPDVGGLWLFAHAPGQLGAHAALTGAQLNANDAVALGLADYLVPSAEIEPLLDVLQDDEPDVLATYQSPRSVPAPITPGARAWIDECYAGDEAAVIADRLASHREPAAREAGATLVAASPTAVSATLIGLRRAVAMTGLRDCLVQDYRVSCRFLEHPDLVEGIRARVIDRDRQPRWVPDSLADVDRSEVENMFEPLGPGADLDLAAG